MIPKWPAKVWYPWLKLKVGGGFFIPTLTPELFADEAVEGAGRLGARAECYAGVYKGQYGLIVIRVQ